MDILANLATGFGAAVTPINLGFCLLGVVLGTAIGVLPGIGPIATIAVLLPITYGAPPLGALIMLAGIMARSTAARPRRSSSICRVSCPPWSPASTAIRWQSAGGPARR